MFGGQGSTVVAQGATCGRDGLLRQWQECGMPQQGDGPQDVMAEDENRLSANKPIARVC